MDRSNLAIIIPAFNEEKTIKRIIKESNSYGTPIVINDASKDKTLNYALETGAIVINHKINGGYDSSINSGCQKAIDMGFKYLITIDADGQHDVANIGLFREFLEKGFDMVVGIRPKKQRITEYLFSFYTKLRWDIDDPLCGLKAYKTSIIQENGGFDKYKSIGTEVLFFTLNNNKAIHQINIGINERADHSRFGSKLTSNLKILKSFLIALMTDISYMITLN